MHGKPTGFYTQRAERMQLLTIGSYHKIEKEAWGEDRNGLLTEKEQETGKWKPKEEWVQKKSGWLPTNQVGTRGEKRERLGG